MTEDDGGFAELVGTELSSAEEGRAAVSLKAEERHLNPSGTVHGGVISTLIDASMAEALNTMTEQDEQPFTIQITVNYMKPGKPGMLTSNAQVRKGGERITIVEAEVVQEEDEVIALATGTYTPLARQAGKGTALVEYVSPKTQKFAPLTKLPYRVCSDLGQWFVINRGSYQAL
jgi:uncharacterized protein (TIGR00369 family)